jgi:hypothetical protein
MYTQKIRASKMKPFTTINQFKIDQQRWINCLTVGDEVKVVRYHHADLNREGVVTQVEIIKETPQRFNLSDGSFFWKSCGFIGEGINSVAGERIVVPVDYDTVPYTVNVLTRANLVRNINFENLNNQQLQGIMLILQGIDPTIEPLFKL